MDYATGPEEECEDKAEAGTKEVADRALHNIGSDFIGNDTDRGLQIISVACWSTKSPTRPV